MPDIDLFNFFRIGVAWVVTVYASIITIQSLYGWYVWLAGQDKYIGLVRRYLVVQSLRLRFKTFWGDVIICLLLCVAFGVLWRAHHQIYALGDTFRSIRVTEQHTQKLHHDLEALTNEQQAEHP